MQFQTQFDARSVEPSSFSPPPPLADYHVKINESEGKPTKDNTGGLLELTLEILDPGPFLGVKVPYRLNLYNQSAQAVDIAYRQLSAICHVTGVFQLQDSRQLHNIPFIATIGPQRDNPQYANVFAVKDLNGNQPGKSPAAGAPAPVAVAPAPAPAWNPAPAAPAAPVAPSGWQPPTPAAAAAPAAPAWAAPAPAAPSSATPAPWQPAPAAPAAPAAAPPWAR